jgi:ABC-type branched-subunit amino acid transport system substrate-binding protein
LLRDRWTAVRQGAAALGLALLLGACAQTTVTERPSEAQAPDAIVGEQAAPVLDRFGRPVDEERIRVALLLPLTGRGSEIGPGMLNAAEMALFDAGVSNFELLPRDTQGTPEGAAAAAQSAIADGARLILGPVFAGEVRPVRTVAKPAGVNVISFSTNRNMAGDNVLVMGVLPSTQVERVVEYTLSQGLTRYAILAPDSAYGRTVVEALEETARNAGGQVVAVQYFEPRAQDYSGPVQAIAARAGEIDALMLAEGGARLRTMAALLPFHGLDNVQLLGTGLWDDARIGREPTLIGGLFAAPEPQLRANFERRYRDTFGSAPPRLATLSYDAVSLATVLARSPFGSTYDWNALTDPSGFIGLDGIFRFLPTGEIERGLAVLEVTAEGPVVRDPAPQSFVGAAF